MTARILHVPYTYFPDPCGGTEVYVDGLVQGLLALGYEPVVAAPAQNARHYTHGGVQVHRFAVDPKASFEQAYGAPDEVAASGFSDICNEIRPAVVHLHARTSAVSGKLVDVAHAIGAKVVFTYHTPTVSCARGTMMLFGIEPCDGVMQRDRCGACTLAARNVPAMAAAAIIRSPRWLARVAGPAGKIGKVMRVPMLIEGMHGRLREFFGRVDHIVAVCGWVRDVLDRNGVPGAKITTSRQGMTQTSAAPMAPGRKAGDPLSIAYFGRASPEKGSDLLAAALSLAPEARVRIDVYAVRQPGSEREIGILEAAARKDGRLRVLAAVPAEDVMATMAAYDLLAVPSRWLESGPLVVLEAFAAGVPVLGANHGGIAELVRDGIDGMLVKPDEATAWAAAIEALARDLDAVRRLRDGVRPPRTMREAAGDMDALYRRLLGMPRPRPVPGTELRSS